MITNWVNRIKLMPALWLAFGVTIYSFFLRFWMHAKLKTTVYDLYFFDQPTWNAAHGKGLLTSILNQSLMADHFYPIFYFLSLFYRIHATPAWLFLFGALCFGVMSYPIFKLAHQYFGRRGLWGIAILLVAYYPFQMALVQDLHGEILMAPLMAWLIYFLEKKQDLWAVILGVAFIFTKETAAVFVIPLGIYYLVVRRRYWLGAGLVVVGLIGMALVFKVILPAFHTVSYPYVSRYGYLGDSFRGILHTMLFRPQVVIMHLVSFQTLGYLVGILVPFSFLPLLSPYMILGAGVIFQNVMAEASTMMSDFSTHYTIPLIPLVFMSFILKLKQYRDTQSPEKWEKTKKITRRVAIFCVALSSFLFVFLQLRNFIVPVAHVRASYEAMALVPPNASVSASTHYMVHMSYRDNINLYPDSKARPDYFVIECQAPYFAPDKDASEYIKEEWEKGSKPSVILALAKGDREEWRHGSMRKVLLALVMGDTIPRLSDSPYLMGVKTLSQDPEYETIFDRDGVKVFRKKAPTAI